MRLLHLLTILALFFPCLGLAAVIEEVISVPVRVRTITGQEISQPIKVTIFRDDKREKAPWLVLNHGRPASEADFAGMKRQRYSANARYFVALGFVVLVPTRVGYGESGGPDVEYSGHCQDKHYPPVYAAGADQTIAVLKAAANLPFMDMSRGIVVGQSFGGTTALTLSTMSVPGLLGAVNFAGGGGGNPATHSANPCSEPRLRALFQRYGASAKIPSLWLYSENDKYWGQELPRQWFNTFILAGGKGRFIQLPPYKDNGHGIFSGNPDSWKIPFEGFLQEIGFKVAAGIQSRTIIDAEPD